MISDILHDAAHEIRRYLKASPESFVAHTDELADLFALLAEMDRIRAKLDRAPVSIELDEHGRERARFYRTPARAPR